jgi:hypothetical protein
MHDLESIRERQSQDLQETFLKKKNKLIRVTLTEDELNYLQHIMWHFTDYMAMDDRPDHGFGILQKYREVPEEKRNIIFTLAAKLRRRHNKH